MASDGNPGTISGVSPAIGRQPVSGNPLPPSGKIATATAAAGLVSSKSTAASRTDPQSLVDQINKYLNDSGRPDQFRVDPASAEYIQQVNPASGAVVGEFLVSEFPALARSVGASSLLIDDVA
jgi:uncharacterized iron-regulated membrane protein